MISQNTRSFNHTRTSMRIQSAIPIFLPGSARVIGEVRGDTFHKQVQASRHQLRSPRAWAFDLSTLADAERAGATQVCLLDTETGTTYEAAIATIRERGFDVARGHGNQVALVLNQYSIDGAPPVAKQHAGTTNQERLDLQPRLFEEVAA